MNAAGRLVTPDGAKIQQLRRARGLNVEAFAARVGCSKPTVQNIESGKRCYLFTLANIAKALDVECQELFVGGASAVVRTERRFEIRISVSVLFDQFDECEQLLRFIELLKSVIGSGHDIEVKDLKAGSVNIALEMSEEDIAKLFGAFVRGRLDILRVTSVTLPSDPEFRLDIDGPPEWHDRGFTLHRDLPPQIAVELENTPPGTPTHPPQPPSPPKRLPRRPGLNDDDDLSGAQ